VADQIPDFDLYAELEVSERASVETIRAAYRSLQLRNHPDRVGDAAAGRAVRLNIAYEWLTDPDRRSRYDARRSSTAPRTSPSRAAGEPDDAAGTEANDGGEVGEVDDRRPHHGPGLLHALRHHLRIDVRRLGRIWIVGLALVGVVAVLPTLGAPPLARIAAATLVVLGFASLALGVGRSTENASMAGLMGRWAGQLIGWVALGVLAVEGVQAVVQLLRGESTPPGVAELTPTALAATAVLSVFAVRRRHGPAETSVDEFLEMSPREFESAVGRVLGNHGYRLRVTGGPGDLVADLTGTDPDGRPTIVQCKRYAPGHPVGSRDVQLLIALGVRHHDAERLVLVTTSDFTDPARDLAEEHGVELISGEDLEDLTR
jgi:restriction system protein